MKAVKTLHCADLHLGCACAGLGRRAAVRKKELEKAFGQILALCAQEPVQLLLIAGDLFDGVHVPAELLALVRDGFAGIPEVTVAIAPGNHDPATADSPYLQGDFWPENVHIFCGEMQAVELPALGVRLFGAGFSELYAPHPLLSGTQAPQDELLNICVLHGELVSSGAGSDYNPITPRLIAQSGMDYIALGHIHQCGEIAREGDCFYAYPGCPAGRGFDELGEKGVYLGELARGRCALRFLPLAGRTFEEVPVDITGAKTSAGAAEAVRAALRARCGESFAENLYKIVLTGAVDEGTALSHDAIAAELSDLFFLKLRDRTTLAVDPATAGDDHSLRGIFLRRMAEQLADSPDDETLKLALNLGLRAFAGEVTFHED